MTLPIWKRQALYVLWYEQSMYDAWCERGTETNRRYHHTICKKLIQQVTHYRLHEGYLREACIDAWPGGKGYSEFYANMQTMLQNLAAMICKNKDSLSYYNYVESGNLRCSCFYEPDDKVCRLEFSVVPTQSLNWYWKKNICSINSLKKDSRRALHHRLSQLAGS